MAIVHEGTRITGNAEKEAIALGATIPSITGFTDFDYIQDVTLSVLKSTVENANPITTFDALIPAVNTLILGVVTNDYVATNTVTSFGEISSVLAEVNPKYGATADSYVCTCKIYVKIS